MGESRDVSLHQLAGSDRKGGLGGERWHSDVMPWVVTRSPRPLHRGRCEAGDARPAAALGSTSSSLESADTPSLFAPSPLWALSHPPGLTFHSPLSAGVGPSLQESAEHLILGKGNYEMLFAFFIPKSCSGHLLLSLALRTQQGMRRH